MEASLDAIDMSSHSATDGVGAMLRKRRMELGLSHEDVASVVKLPPRRIEAMEQERWNELPDGPYLRGFLKNIARALDLDADTLMARVDDSLVKARNPESILVPMGSTNATLPRRSGPASERHAGRSLVIGAFLFAIVAAVIAWSGTDSFDRVIGRGKKLVDDTSAVVATGTSSGAGNEGQVKEEVLQPATQVAAAPTAPATTSSGTTEAPAAAATTPAATGSALRFHFNEESWVEVRAGDGKVLLSRLNAAGSEQTIDGAAPFTLIVGNAKGVALQFRGQPVDLGPYTRDQVARLTLS